MGMGREVEGRGKGLWVEENLVVVRGIRIIRMRIIKMRIIEMRTIEMRVTRIRNSEREQSHFWPR